LSILGWFDISDLLRSVVIVLRDRWLTIDGLTSSLLLLLVFAALVRFENLKMKSALIWPAVALFLLFLVAPMSINGSYFVNGRIFPYALALLILSINTDEVAERRRLWVAALSVAFMLLRIATNTASLALYDKSYSSQLQAIAHIPEGAAVMTLQHVPCQKSSLGDWFNQRLYNLSAIAVVRRHAFVNMLFTIPGLHMLQTHFDAAGPFAQIGAGNVTIGESCRTDFGTPIADVLAQIPYTAFDQLWIIDIPRTSWPHDDRLRLIWSEGSSALFQISK